jgi:hypothetical protein
VAADVQVNQSTLANAFADCAFWLYPTSFEETSCITAMKAQVSSGSLARSARHGSARHATFGHFPRSSVNRPM